MRMHRGNTRIQFFYRKKTVSIPLLSMVLNNYQLPRLSGSRYRESGMSSCSHFLKWVFSGKLIIIYSYLQIFKNIYKEKKNVNCFCFQGYILFISIIPPPPFSILLNFFHPHVTPTVLIFSPKVKI